MTIRTTNLMSFTVDVEAIIEILGIGQSLFFGICVFMARRRNPANIYLVAFMFAFAVSYFDGLLGSLDVEEPLGDFLWPADYLLPPLIYLYVTVLITPNPASATRRRWLHFLPFALSILALLPYFTLSEPLLNATLDLGWVAWEPRDGGGVDFDGDTAPLQLVVALFGLLLFYYASLLQATIYIFLMVVIYWRYRRRIKDVYSNIDKLKLKWLGFIAGLFFLVWLVVFPIDVYAIYVGDVSPLIEVGTMAAMLLAIYALGLVGLRQTVVFDVEGAKALAALADSASAELGGGVDEPDGQTGKASGKYARSALSDDDERRIAAKVEATMARDQLFLDSTLTLQMLAERTGISVNYISQAINQHLQRNFFDFVNGYRIEEAKRLLATTDDSVLDIALAVGFNAKSTFNAAFKKAAGVTPSRYRIDVRTADESLSAA